MSAVPGQMAFETADQARARGGSRWTPPTLEDFAYGRVVAFDQTINSTGVAVLIHSPERGLVLAETDLLRPQKTDLKSHEGTYHRASCMDRGIHDLVSAYDWAYGSDGESPRVVFERPAVVGMRTESALLAGLSVYRASLGLARMVSNRHAKAVLLGRAGSKADPVTKAHVKEAVERYLTPPTGSPWNEHVRDACMLGLVHLFDLKKGESNA